MTLLSLVACAALTTPSKTPGTTPSSVTSPSTTTPAGGTRDTGDTGASGDTGLWWPPVDFVCDPSTTPPFREPVAPLCASIVGTANVAIVSRADPTVIARPDPVEPAVDLAAFAGPDAWGRYWLVEQPGILKRSDDLGCTWTEVGGLPEAFHFADPWWQQYGVIVDLFTDPSTDTVYASQGGSGLWALRGGEEWRFAATHDLDALTVDPADPCRLLGFGRFRDRLEPIPEIRTSPDGGVTWSPHLDLVASSEGVLRRGDFGVAAEIGTTLRVYDGVAWQERPRERLSNAHAAWSADALHLQVFEDVGAHNVLRIQVSTDLGVTFRDHPVVDDRAFNYRGLAADGDLTVATGWHDEIVDGGHAFVQILTGDGDVVHRLAGDQPPRVAFASDRILLGVGRSPAP